MKKKDPLSTNKLLRAVVDDFPRMKKSTSDFITKMGANADFLHYSALPPVATMEIATFSKGLTKPLSPMLMARYSFASDVLCGVDVWPCITKIRKLIASKPIQALHKSLKKDWDESAPKQFKDHDLSVFGYTEDVPENIIYLAWASDIEPQVIVYDGFDEIRFENIDEYLSFFLYGEKK